MFKKSFALLFGLALLLCASSTVFASGFAIVEQSVSGLGVSFAGSVSGDDPSAMFFNPASISLLEGQQATAGLHVIIPSAKFSATTATNALGGSLGTNNSGDGGVTKLVPNFYYSNKLSDKLSIGLGINAPFGLATDYDKNWVGRYHAKESDVATININPVVAFKVTDQLTLAAGVSAEYMEATLSSMVDGGLVNASLAQGYAADMADGTLDNPIYGLANLAMAADPTNISSPANDIFVENSADDWGYGFNLGLLYEFSTKTRVGLAYRSEITHKLKGDVTSSVPSTVNNLLPLFQKQDINGSITLPATASANFYSKVTDKLALMADVTWTGWSSFDELTINFEGTGIAGSSSSTTTEKWEDTWRYSVGATYQATEALLIRTGLAYDETPIPDDYRTPRIPGEDRFWVSLGAGYQITESLSLDAAYAHLFVKDSKIQKYATVPEDQSRGTLVGEYKNSVDIASIQINYKF